MPKLMLKAGAVEIWEVAGEFYVYGVLSDPVVCPSIGMAREVAAGA